jgi:hypothetical protein
MQQERFSPPQLFVSYGIIAAGAVLFARHPGSRAVVILDWPLLFLLSVVALAPLFLAERRLSRALRQEAQAYPYRGSVLVALFAVSVVLVGVVNGNFARSPPRVLRPTVVAWQATQKIAAGDMPVPEREGRFEPMLAEVESWRDPEETIVLPVSIEAQEQAQGPGPHVVEVVVPPGFLGVEYVEAVRLVTP